MLPIESVRADAINNFSGKCVAWRIPEVGRVHPQIVANWSRAGEASPINLTPSNRGQLERAKVKHVKNVARNRDNVVYAHELDTRVV